MVAYSLKGYHIISIIGYIAGLFIAMFVSEVFKAAQPALLYIVPSTLLPIMIAGYINGQFRELWNGIQSAQKPEEEADLEANETLNRKEPKISEVTIVIEDDEKQKPL